MFEFKGKDVLVIGLGGRGRAASELLCDGGANVTAIDQADTPELREAAQRLRALGVEVILGAASAPPWSYAAALLSPAVPGQTALVQSLMERGIPILSELEVGFQWAQCLAIAVAGTNGKGTTAEMVERMLLATGRKTMVAGHRARPVCAVAQSTRDLDFLILKANVFQLQYTQCFRPAVAVLSNLAPDHLERFGNADDFARANGRLFQSQQAFDWAVVQSEALARLRQLGVPVPGKVITFSASDPKADLHLDRGLILSRLPNWTGPLLDLDQCQVRGPHNAENLMAALAVGHALRLPLEAMTEPLQTYSAGPHRFELVAEVNGVQYINDSKATNLDALHKALLATRSGQGGQPNVWLIAGGVDQGLEYHDLGPLLSRHVKRVFLVGAATEKIRAAWSLFTPCTAARSLVEAITEAAKNATSGDVVLLSPACSSLDQFQDYQHRGAVFCQTVKSIGRGA